MSVRKDPSVTLTASRIVVLKPISNSQLYRLSSLVMPVTFISMSKVSPTNPVTVGGSRETTGRPLAATVTLPMPVMIVEVRRRKISIVNNVFPRARVT